MRAVLMSRNGRGRRTIYTCAISPALRMALKATQTWRALAIGAFLLAPVCNASPTTAETTDLASLRSRLGVLIAKGDNEEALKLAQTVVARVTDIHGPDHLETARCLCDEAKLNANIGSYLEALRLYARALSIRESQLGLRDPSVADILVASAEVLQADDRSEEAAPLLRRALAIREEQLGAGHSDTADTLSQLGVCLFAQDAYDDAGVLFERCLVIREKTLGPRHPNTAQALTNLSAVYRERENYGKAKMLVARAFAIRSEALGSDHEDTVDSICDMGLLWFLEENYEGAERCFDRVLQFRRSQFGDSDPQARDIANLLIATYRAQGKETEAAAVEGVFVSAKSDAAQPARDAAKEINDK